MWKQKQKIMKKIPLSIRIIYIFSKILHSLTALFCLLTIIVSIFLFSGSWLDKLDMSIVVPIKSNSEEVGKASFYGQEMDVTFADAKGKINFMDVPKLVARFFAVQFVLLSLITFFLVHLFFRFIKNVYRGVIFEIDNFRILRNLGISLLGFYFYILITTQLWKQGFSSNHVFSDIYLSFGSGTMPILIGALFVLMLSQIFLRGLELQEENKLTV